MVSSSRMSTSVSKRFLSVRTCFNGREACEKGNGVHDGFLARETTRSQNPCSDGVNDEHVKEKPRQPRKVFAARILALLVLLVTHGLMSFV